MQIPEHCNFCSTYPIASKSHISISVVTNKLIFSQFYVEIGSPGKAIYFNGSGFLIRDKPHTQAIVQKNSEALS